MSNTLKTKIYGWFLVILGISLIIWVIYSLIAEFTYIGYPEPMRSAIRSGESEIYTSVSTRVWNYLCLIFWTLLGAGFLHFGIKKIKSPASLPHS